MKKSLKKTCAVVMAVAATAGVAGAQGVVVNNYNNAETKLTAYADPAVTNVMTITNFEKSVKLGDTFVMPTATFDGNNVEECTVKTPSGKTQTVGTVEVDGDNVLGFEVSEVGTYTITYTYGEYSGSVTFESKASTYTLTLEKNGEKVLPNKVGTGYTGNLYVSEYTVKDKDGNVVNDVDVTVTVTSPKNKTYELAQDGSIDFGEDALVKGTYTVDYRVSKNGYFLTQEKKTFKVVEGDAYTANKLELAYASEKPESINVGKPVTLPAVTATRDGESVNANFSVAVYKNGTELVNAETEVHDTTVLAKNEDGKYVFTAKETANYYEFRYTATDALGATGEASFVVTTVGDTLEPTPIVVEAYEKDATAGLVNVDYKLALKFNPESEIEMLAVYAEDYGTFDFAGYTFKREIKNSSLEVVYTDTAYPNEILAFNYQGTLEDLNHDEDGAYRAKGQEENTSVAGKVYAVKDGELVNLADGTYTIYYTATDAAGKSKVIHYEFTVDSDYDVNNETVVPKPTVQFNDTLYYAVDKGDVIEFSQPTYSDKNDSRLETKVTYQYFNGQDAVGEELEMEIGSNSKYSLDTTNAPAGATSVKFVATAKNDAEKVGTAEQEVVIYSQATGEGIPTIYSVGDYENEAEQGTEITLPTVVFTDIKDSNYDSVDALNASITVTCNDVEYVVSNATQVRSGNYLYVMNGKFVAAVAGNYQVAVKATDAAGNVAIQFLNYTVSAVNYIKELRFTNIGVTNSTIELGESFNLPKATIANDDNNEYDYYVKIESESSSAFNQQGNYKFTPQAVGEYTVTYVMYNKVEGPIDGVVEGKEATFKVTVKDTTAPEIQVNWSSEYILLKDAEEEVTGDIQNSYEKGVKILLPTFSAYDLSKLDTTKSTITISNGSSTRTIKYSEMVDENKLDGKLYYTFNKDAEYTVKYTAYDVEGNTSNKSFTIKVGDNETPEFEVSDSIMKSKYSIGDQITIDLTSESDYLTLSDNVTTYTYTDGNTSTSLRVKDAITVKLTCDGSTVENEETEKGKYLFTLKDAGKYELTFTVKDEAGNTSEVVKTFEIAAKSSSSISKTQAVGTVLIVLSVVVLAGVVVYFVISKRKMDKIYK